MTQKLYAEIKVIIADDHEIFRDGLLSALESEEKLNVIAQASNGEELIEIVTSHSPDVVLVDIQMPVMDGIEATKQLRKLYPSLGILALTFKEDDDSIMDMIKAGVNGYIVKSALKQEIIEAVITIYQGNNYYCQNIQSRFADLLRLRSFDRTNVPKGVEFTSREIAIIKLICKEYNAQEIADKLGSSNRTIENQKLKIQKKMHVKSAQGIIIYALKNKIVLLNE